MCLILIIIMYLSFNVSAFADPIPSNEIRVIDGDTIRIADHDRNIRLVGYNAPEIRNAKCSQEKEFGQRANARLSEIIAQGSLDLTFVRCSCRPGTLGSIYCNRGRSCAVLKSNEVDVARILISEGLAVPFICGRESCPPIPRPWC